jgi:alpha-L-fucosidase
MKFHLLACCFVATFTALAAEWPIAEGPFQPSLESLANYQCPDWFRDAKFGISAHWGPQCEPEDGDWYARNMYIQGHRNYQTHTNRFGHPSEFGFKDVCNVWKADQFDPEKLMALYKKAGAQYFVAMANHHDNFDNWDSKYQPWNSVKIGPKKDLIGLWEKAARKAGLRFGVTVHAARAWEWYEASQLSDTNGPKAGVPYDGNLTAADGKGTWWEGLDPQDLYAQRHPTSSDVINRKNPNRTRGAPPNAAYCQKFYNRVIDLIDSYKADLLYFDDGGLPLGGVDRQIGLSIAAHLYNSSIKEHGGRNDAVMNTKRINDEMRKCWVLDIERGVTGGVDPRPWQTDTCIGAWHYQRSVYEQHQYKTVTQVVHTLMDIVSKNGNLLLSIPVRGNGTIDEDEEAFLAGLADWMAVNREAVYGTRPWKIFGEGPAALEKGEARGEGAVRDTRNKPYTAQDFRFTTKGDALYATAYAWPTNGQLVVRTLAARAPGIRGDVTGVELLGCREKIAFKREASGLVVTLPAKKPCEHAYVLKITGFDLADSEPTIPAR